MQQNMSMMQQNATKKSTDTDVEALLNNVLTKMEANKQEMKTMVTDQIKSVQEEVDKMKEDTNPKVRL